MVSLQCPLRQALNWKSGQRMDLQRLREIEEHVSANSPGCRHRPLKDVVFDSDTFYGRTSPLLMACHWNELNCVKRIVEFWGVNVNQAAAYYFHPYDRISNLEDPSSKIEKATPLFVAAYMGHLDIVRYLVTEAGADISIKTLNKDADYDGLSPLYGAVWEKSTRLAPSHADYETRIGIIRENRSAIVRLLLESGADRSVDSIRPSDGNPMWTSRLCDIEAITTLVEHGMGVNHRYPKLNAISLLNYCVEKKSLAVVEFLVDNGAELHTQDSWGFTPIIRAAYYRRWNVFDFLLGRKEISRIEKIEALELAGAVILNDTKPTSPATEALFPKGFEYWRESLRLRLMDVDGSGPFIKKSPMKPGRIVEWATSEELERVIQHRSEQEIQAFLIQLRILSAKSWVAVYSDYRYYLKDHLEGLREQRRWVEVIHMLWSMLETIPSFDERQKSLWEMTSRVVQDLLKTLTEIERDNPLLNEDTINTTLKLILAMDHLDDGKFIVLAHRYNRNWMTWMYILIRLLAELPHLVNEESMECLKELVKLDQRRAPLLKKKARLHHHLGFSFYEKELLLHEPFKYNDPHPSHYPEHLIIPALSLLLRAGADPNVGDDKGNGALHALAMASKNCVHYTSYPSIQESVARLLLNSGAHLDRVNDKGETAADVWMTIVRKKRRWDQSEIIPKTDLPSWLRPDDPVPKLQCECAKVIRSNGVPYKNVLPPSLHPFVSWH